MEYVKKTSILAPVIACTILAVSNSSLSGAGCGERPQVTFEKDVAPILQSKCQVCHNRLGMAPMSLVTYNECRPWARSIKEKVVNRAMPPFYAGGPIGYYENDTRLTDAEISLVSRWVDGGAARGDPADHPKDRDWSADQQRPKPDLMLTAEQPYTVKKGSDDYELFPLDYVFPHDTWIKGIDIIPGNRAAIHHAGLYMLPDTLKPAAGGHIEGGSEILMGATLVMFWLPGGRPRTFRDGTALLIPKGTRLGIQVHYAPTASDNVVDRSGVALYYANGVIEKMVHFQFGGKRKLEIPAGAEQYELTDYRKLKTDAIITGFGAHMHLRGKSFSISLIYPDNRRETVFEIPQWYFNWQRSYVLISPLAVPAGTVVEYKAVWDNSSRNPYNPDPNQVVRNGERTTDEMMGGSISYLVASEQLGISVRNGVRIDAGGDVRSEGRQ